MTRAPSWTVVFLLGALWNALIERSLWATAFCIACAAWMALFDHKR